MTSKARWFDVYTQPGMTLDRITLWGTGRKYFCFGIDCRNDGICPLCWSYVCLGNCLSDGAREPRVRSRITRGYFWSLYIFPMGRMKYHGAYGNEPYSEPIPSLYPPDDTRRCYARLNDRSTYLCASGVDSSYLLCRLDGV